MGREIVLRSFGTHDGSFHADEVMACGLLLLFDLIDRHRIVRTRDYDELSTCEYVCDVGGLYDPEKKRFDHHQLDYRGNLSSAGMILENLESERTISPSIYRYFNRSLIEGIDAVDTGRSPPVTGHCSFSGVIANFVPARYDAGREEVETGFYAALDFVCEHLTRLLKKFHYIEECREEIRKEMVKNKSVLVFDRSMPWVEVFFELGGEDHPAQFVVMPAGDQWKLRGVPPSYNRRMEVRVPLPNEWAGLIGDDLRKETGISGAVFCHKGRFISIWQTKRDALRALSSVLKGESLEDDF